MLNTFIPSCVVAEKIDKLIMLFAQAFDYCIIKGHFPY